MSSEKKVAIGVVGVGHLGRWHTQQLSRIPEANLVGVYDIDSSRAREVAGAFHTRTFPNFQDLLRHTEALSIVTPTTTHFQYAMEALQAGKHVFVEKPITETVAQGEELVAAARERGLKLQVGHIERFNPALLALEGIQLRPLFVESHRLSTFHPRGTDVAVVLDLMIHDIDLILSLVDSPVREIHASGVSIISGSEDIANCRLDFENGAVANVTASRISNRKMRKMRFFQPNAYISVDFLEGFSEVYELVEPSRKLSSENLSFSVPLPGKDGTAREIRYTRLEKKEINPLNYELSLFINSILQDTEPPVTGEEAVRALRVAQSILQKIDEHAQLVKKHWRV